MKQIVKDREQQINMVCYVDNVVLVTNFEEKLQHLLHKFINVLHRSDSENQIAYNL